MDQSESKPNRLPVIPTWSDLCPDLLRSVFGLLSFTNLKQTKLVCRSWNSASRSCVPKKNQIPWLILFPKENQTNSNNNCVLFVPDDKDNLYKTRDLGADFTQSSCVASYGSWLLMLDHFQNLYIINPLTLERIDLPHSYLSKKDIIRPCPACLWIDSITKNYLVVWIVRHGMVYTRKGDGRWRTGSIGPVQDAEKNFYNWKDQKVYITTYFSREVFIWDFSDDIPRQSGSLLPFSIYALRDDGPIHWARVLYFDSMIATTVTGQVLFVACLFQDSRWKFCMCGYDALNKTWEKVEDLGDEALIWNTGFTVVAKDIPGLKRNSIYFSGNSSHHRTEHIFVYDLGTRTTERLPQWVVSSVAFSSYARWFFPDITC